MTSSPPLSLAPDLPADAYLVLGLARCFVKEDGDIHEVNVLEPIPSAALETLFKGIATSYQMAWATTVGAVFREDTVEVPPQFPGDTQLCDDFVERAIAAARTYRIHPEVQSLLPKETLHEGFNFSTERKRVLNSERIVKVEDNVKQHEYTHRVL